jgi:DNA-binding GntR family transcriptional regulator
MRVRAASSLTDQVVEAVREAIRAGQLRPGQLYSVYQLADQLQISRTPVREGLLRLAEAGMIEIARNRGFRVLDRDHTDVAEVFHLRLLLEIPAVRRAARRVDDALLAGLHEELAAMRTAALDGDTRFMRHDQRFHARMLAAGGNRKLVELVNNLRDITTTLGASTTEKSRTLSDIADEHEPILAAIAARDADAAAIAVRSHLAHTARLLIEQAVGGPDELRPDHVELIESAVEGLSGKTRESRSTSHVPHS